MENMYHCDKCNQDVPKGFLHKCPMNRDPLLVEREKAHGSFKKTAYAAMEIKKLFRRLGDSTDKSLPDSVDQRQAEALDMIATKVARILSGNHLEPDHWLDIAGYAKLGAEACGER